MQDKLNWLVHTIHQNINSAYQTITQHYQVAAGTAGGTIITFINFDKLNSELVPRLIIAVACTAVSFITSIGLKYISDKIKKWRK